MQSRAVEIETAPLPPLAVKDDWLLLTEIAHLLELGAVTEVEEEVQREDARAMNPAQAIACSRLRLCIRSTGQDLMHGARHISRHGIRLLPDSRRRGIRVRLDCQAVFDSARSS
jgi:hypothetical protein